MNKNENPILVSFICIYNKERFYNLMLNSIKTTNIRYVYEIVGINNSNNEHKSMVEALNFAKKVAKGSVFVFLHQDILFNSSTNLNLLVDICLKQIALCGVFGVRNDGDQKKSISCITDLWREYDGLTENEIQECFTIDECMFACNKLLFEQVDFDEKLCKYWDFYAVDLSLQCQLANIPVYSVGLKLTHYSKGNINTKYFKKVERKLLKKYRDDFNIITYPCGWNYTSSKAIAKRRRKEKGIKNKERIKGFLYTFLHLKKFLHKIKRKIEKHLEHLRLCFEKKGIDNKIVLVTHSTSKTGAPLLALNIIKELRKNNYSVVCLSMDIDGEGGLYGDFKAVSKFFFSKPSYKIICLLKRKGYSNFLINSFASASILKYLPKENISITYLIHELPDVIMRLNQVKYIDDVDKYSNVIVFPSRFTKEQYEKAFGKNETKTIIKPQGLYQCGNLNIDRNIAKAEVCRLLQIEPNKKILLSIGTGDKRKGIDLFYELALNMQKYPDYIFVWVGPIYYKLDIKYQNLHNVRHVEYIDDKSLLYKFYRSATFYLMISRNEPFGTIILESFTAETPVIAFEKAGGYLDILVNNETGFLVKYLDVYEYEKTIIEKQSYEKLNYVINNAKLLLKKFKFDEYVECLIDTFRNKG